MEACITSIEFTINGTVRRIEVRVKPRGAGSMETILYVVDAESIVNKSGGVVWFEHCTALRKLWESVADIWAPCIGTYGEVKNALKR